MPYANIRLQSRIWSPAARATGETRKLFTLEKGQRVLWASCIPIVNAAASSTSTASLGDGDGVAGYISTSVLDLETSTAGTPVNGDGTYLATSGGKLYTAEDTVDVTYVANTYGATTPKVRFTIATLQEYVA